MIQLLLLLNILHFTISGVLTWLDGRVIGGIPVTIEEFPYQVSVQISGLHSCGGSIISPDYILTAGHCTEHWEQLDSFSVRVGSSFCKRGGEVINVKEIFRHPLYSQSTQDYDISILKLNKSIKFNTNKAAIDLISEKTEVYSTTSNLIVSGWGLTKEDGKTSDQLQAVSVPLVPHNVCKEEYEIYNFPVTNRMICAGEKLGEKDACQGDSGGPLVSAGVQVGVVSWGIGCARPELPGVYSKISELRTFIKNVTNI